MRKSESTKSHFSPAMSWKTRLTLYMGSAITDTAQRPDGTLNRRLLNVLDLKAHPTPQSLHHVRTNDVSIDPSRNLWFRIFTPTNTNGTTSSLPLFVFFHGGGFAYLSPASKSYDAVCRRIARRVPAVIASVNYRLSPEYRFPCQYSDGFDVLKFLDSNTSALDGHNADPSRCFLAGDSAGANLAHHVAVSACKAELRRVKIMGLVSIQPFFGGEERTEAEMRLVGAPLVSMKRTDWLWRVFLPDGEDRDHGAANVSGPNAEDISGLDFPETVVFVGGSDPLQDWQRRYGEWLRKSGKKADIIEYPNMIHAFYVFPELPEASQLIDQVRDFVNIRLSSL